MRTSALRHTLLAAGSALTLAACEQILGFSDATSATTGGTGGTGGASTTTTGAGGGTTTGTGGGTTAGPGGAGGAGGASTTTTGAGGAGGSGGGCPKDATRPCYDGPAGTEGIGACAAGLETCDGAAWGPCVGAVLPAVEDCATLDADESCDGLPACSGAYRWAKGFGDGNGQYGNGLAADAAGDLVVVGRATGIIDFGGGPLICDGTDAFVAKFDARGAPLWSKNFSSPNTQQALSVAARGGRVAVVGEVVGSIDLGGGPLSGSGNTGFVAVLDPSGGHVWSRLLGSAGVDVAAVGIDGNGDVLVAGQYKGSPDLGLGPLPDALLAHAYVVKLAQADGHTLWVSAFGASQGSDSHTTTALAVDSAGDPIVSLTFKGSVIPPGDAAPPCGSKGARVVALDAATGTQKWTWGTCDATAGVAHVPSALGVDAADDVFVAGSFTGSIDLGVGGPRPSAGAQDVFLLKLGPLGAPLVGAVFGDGSDQRAFSLAVDGAGNVAIAGPSGGTVDFGGGPVVTFGHGAFLAKFDGQLAHRWSRGFSDASGLIAGDVTNLIGYRALAALPTGDLAWATGFSFTTDLGGGMLSSTGPNNDVLVALFAP